VNETDEATVDGLDELNEAVLIDLLTGDARKPTEVEELVQRTIRVLAEEYSFPLESMARDVVISVEGGGRRQRKTADLVMFTPGLPHGSPPTSTPHTPSDGQQTGGLDPSDAAWLTT